MDQSRICSVAVFVIYILMSEIIGENDRITQKPVGQKQLFCCSMSPNETPESGSRVETQTFYLGWNKKQRIIGVYWKLLSHRLSFDMLTFPPQRGVKPFTETLKHVWISSDGSGNQFYLHATYRDVAVELCGSWSDCFYIRISKRLCVCVMWLFCTEKEGRADSLTQKEKKLTRWEIKAGRERSDRAARCKREMRESRN